jgi:hypothetical protein
MLNTLNELTILSATINEPRAGVWHADVEVDLNGGVIEGDAVLDVDGSRFVGTVYRGGVEQGRWHGRLVGGAGRMGAGVPAKFFRSTTVLEMVEELLSADPARKEKLAASSATNLRDVQVAQWARAVGRAGEALWKIVDFLNAGGAADYAWRVTRAGEVLVAADSFPAFEFSAEPTLIEESPREGAASLAPAGSPELVPGVTYGGRRVSRVVTTLASGGLRQRYWVED